MRGPGLIALLMAGLMAVGGCVGNRDRDKEQAPAPPPAPAASAPRRDA